MSTGVKIAATLAIVLGGVGYMIWTTVSGGEALEYYKQVDELMRDPEAWKGRRLQLHGNVVEGTILKRRGSLDFRFGLHRKSRWIDVAYSGLVPDGFRDCAELIVKGRLTAAGGFAADEISSKCPSKYDGKRQTGQCGRELGKQVLARRRAEARPSP